MRILILAFTALLVSCDSHQSELASMNQRIAALEGRVTILEQSVHKQQQAIGNWTLWQVSEAFNAGYPQAMSAYASKGECLEAAAGWTYPGGTVVSQDPTIFQLKGYRIRLECLPVGTTPYAH